MIGTEPLLTQLALDPGHVLGRDPLAGKVPAGLLDGQVNALLRFDPLRVGHRIALGGNRQNAHQRQVGIGVQLELLAGLFDPEFEMGHPASDKLMLEMAGGLF